MIKVEDLEDGEVNDELSACHYIAIPKCSCEQVQGRWHKALPSSK